MLFNLRRKLLPMEALRTRSDAYVADGLLDLDCARKIIEVIEQERRAMSYLNDGGEDRSAPQSLSWSLNVAELRAELQKREALMQAGPGDGITDQVGGKESCVIPFLLAPCKTLEEKLRNFLSTNRVACLLRDHRLSRQWSLVANDRASQRRNREVVRLLISLSTPERVIRDAVPSASEHALCQLRFLLTTVFLYCIVNGLCTKSAAPTGLLTALFV